MRYFSSPEIREQKKQLRNAVITQRQKLQLTQKHLAELIPIDKGVVRRVESGSIDTSFENFFRVLNAVGLNCEIVLTPKAK